MRKPCRSDIRACREDLTSILLGVKVAVDADCREALSQLRYSRRRRAFSRAREGRIDGSQCEVEALIDGRPSSQLSERSSNRAVPGALLRAPIAAVVRGDTGREDCATACRWTSPWGSRPGSSADRATSDHVHRDAAEALRAGVRGTSARLRTGPSAVSEEHVYQPVSAENE